jgi:hypothetical protein
MSEVYPNSCACHLRISALKAENEALKKERKQIIDSEIDCGARSVAKDDEIEGLRQELRRYTSWQPSDPGTKEAMEHFGDKPYSCSECGTDAQGVILVHALRAATVRLEEAESVTLHTRSSDGLGPVCVSIECLQRDLAVARKERDEYYQNWQAERQVCKERHERIEFLTAKSDEGVRFGKGMMKDRGELMDKLAALTASLASVTSEVERLKSEKDYDGKEVLDAELAELRKRMERLDRIIDAAQTALVINGDHERTMFVLKMIDVERGNTVSLASPPSPAPTDPEERIVQLHKSCGCVTCVCESEIQCGGCGAKNCGNHPSPAPVESKVN